MTTLVDLNLLKKYDEKVQANVERLYLSKSDYATDKNSFALKSEIPTVPTDISAFTNDRGYVTSRDVSSAISTSIANITSIKYEIVSGLPSTGLVGTIYLVPNGSSAEKNIYNEYIYVNNKFEKLGSTEISLTNYALKSEIPTVPTKVSAFTNDSGYLTSANLPTKVSQLQNDSDFATKSYVDNKYTLVSSAESETYFNSDWNW